MKQVCERLFEIHGLFKVIDSGTSLKASELAREIAFSLDGLQDSPNTGPVDCKSLSQRTSITIREGRSENNKVEFDFGFYSLEPPVIEGVGGHDQMRRTLLARIDGVLQDWPTASKRNGSTSPFEVFITHPDVALDREGLLDCTKLVSRIVDAIEGR